MDNTLPKRRITITGLLLMIYFSLIACKNSQLFIYWASNSFKKHIVQTQVNFNKASLECFFPDSSQDPLPLTHIITSPDLFFKVSKAPSLLLDLTTLVKVTETLDFTLF